MGGKFSELKFRGRPKHTDFKLKVEDPKKKTKVQLKLPLLKTWLNADLASTGFQAHWSDKDSAIHYYNERSKENLWERPDIKVKKNLKVGRRRLSANTHPAFRRLA